MGEAGNNHRNIMEQSWDNLDKGRVFMGKPKKPWRKIMAMGNSMNITRSQAGNIIEKKGGKTPVNLL